MLIPQVSGTDQTLCFWYRRNFLFSFLYFPHIHSLHVRLLFKFSPHVDVACKELIDVGNAEDQSGSGNNTGWLEN